MADLPEVNNWEPGIYQLETSDPVLGGPEGIDNQQAKQLANRTQWLRDQIQKILDGVTTIGKAAQLATARTLRFKGAATGSGTYDGSADTEITLALVDSGVAAGTYTKVTLNAKGIATGGSNPTVLTDYGITFASQVEAETGADTNKPMSALRVFQAIAAKVIQATESVLGIARIATQLVVDAGTDDTTIVSPKKLSKFVADYVGSALTSATEALAGLAKIATQALVDAGVDDSAYVTPKKLRWGFQILKATNGYIIFPTFLGGWIVQWGSAPVAASTTAVYGLPIPFPNNYFVGVCQSTTLGMTTNYTTGFGMRPIGRDKIELQNNYSGSGISLGYIAIGN